MNIWLKSTSIGLAAAIFVFFSPTILGKKKTATTYDATYRLKVDMLKKNSTMNMVKSILEKRLEDEGHIFSITKTATDSLIVIVKNVADTTYNKKLLTANGQLQFREMYTLSEMASAIIAGIKIWQTETNETTTPPTNDTTPVSLSNLMDSSIATTIQKKEPESLIEKSLDFSM